ncbi:MAG: iron-sulfur cluster-binding protein, partial [Planctomycetia bacterium]|nr:iron-sulfur cluster-binding protein [Planctomycetia bacterium]
MTDYLRETHHEFLAASREALADARLQQILGQLGDTLGRRNREAWAALPNSDLIR